VRLGSVISAGFETTGFSKFLVRKADPWNFSKLGKGYSGSGYYRFSRPVYSFGRGFLTKLVELL